MKKPHFFVNSTLVKIMDVEDKIIYRHFFEWTDRSSLKGCYLHLTLIRADGTTIDEPTYIKFKSVKQVGTIDSTLNGVTTRLPQYSESPYFFLDASEIAIGYDYYTATITRKSDPILAVISREREDLRTHQTRLVELSR